MVYASSIAPLLYWHAMGPFEINWFKKGDFFYFQNASFGKGVACVFLVLFSIWMFVLFFDGIKNKKIRLGAPLMSCGTALTWWTGMGIYPTDFVFSFTNVIAHGIPYMALIWIFGQRQFHSCKDLKIIKINAKNLFSFKYVWVFLSVLFGFAYLEEGLWDRFFWHEHENLFPFFQIFPTELLLPILSVPHI